MIIDRDKTCWLVVGDGASAKFFTLQTRPLHIEPIPMAPLVNHASERHGAVPQDRKDRFTVRVATAIAEAAGKKSFHDLVIVAPDHMLGELRNDLDPAIRKMVIFELAGDWANLPTADLVAHLKPHLQPAA